MMKMMMMMMMMMVMEVDAAELSEQCSLADDNTIMLMMIAFIILCLAELSEQCSLDDDDDRDDDDRFYLAPFSALQSYLNSVH